MILFIVAIMRMLGVLIDRDENVKKVCYLAGGASYLALVMQMLTRILYTVLK